MIFMMEDLSIRNAILEEINSSTASDLMLSKLLETLKAGWPTKKEDVAQECWPYCMFRAEVVVEDSILYKDNRCIVLRSLRAKVH